MKSKHLTGLCLLAFAAMLTSCSKDPVSNLSAEESRIYITDYSKTVNFGGYHTFYISDSAAVVDENSATKEATDVDVAFINAVKNQMAARGYVYVPRDSTPDLGIVVNRIYNTSTGVVNYNSYYDDYGSYWDPYYWGYNGYGYYSPYNYEVYSVTEGALAVDIFDLQNAAANNSINAVWTGLIRGSGIFNVNTAPSQVNQLFQQSPYLQTH